jgi:predicted kinase
MDLKMHGRADLAEYFLTVYADRSDDFDLFPLVDFYESRHAYLRAQKKAYLASHQAIGTRQQKKADQAAQRLFKLAFSTDRRPLLPPIMVIMSGLVASGKSTVARAVARDISAPVVLSDHARDALLGLHRVEELSSSEWEHAFSPKLHEEVYNEVFRRSRLALQSGRPIVVDGCFGSRQLRTRIRGLALECGVPFLFVECHCPENVITERLRQRSELAGIEEKTWMEISDGFKDKWESVEELSEMEHLVVDTSKPLEDTIALLRKRLPTWPTGLTQ